VAGGPLGTVPELLFEKKGLILSLHQLLVEAENNPKCGRTLPF